MSMDVEHEITVSQVHGIIVQRFTEKREELV